jgi:hypothetical protein
MKYVETIEDKTTLVANSFSGLIGKEISSYEIAKVCIDDEWSYWHDLPIYISFGNEIISISWTQLNELGITPYRVLPFDVSGFILEWHSEGFEPLDKIIGTTILSVSLGKGEFSIEGEEVEIWTKLFISLSNGNTLEIYNALDENGFFLHKNKINDEQRVCT